MKIEKKLTFQNLVHKPSSLLGPLLPIIPQQIKLMDLLIEEFGVGNPTPEPAIARYLRTVNATKPFTRHSDPYQIFEYYLEQLVLHGAVTIQDESFSAIRAKYAGNIAIRVIDDEGKCQCAGVVTEVYQYGDLVMFAVWDTDEPLAWAMVYLGSDLVQHYDKVYKIEIKETKEK